jgi:S-adenosyl-L-methionine hydrolase (adenosine-forming)
MPSAPHPLITLTTDFGTADHFAGVMKGVIAGIAPRARVVDITHEVAPYDVIGAAFLIAQSWRYFPKGSIHVVVVDPGVGSARRPILVAGGGHFFVAPDNGVLSMVIEDLIKVADVIKVADLIKVEAVTKREAAKPKVRVIANPKLMARDVSRTFHGRDIFAPAAAHLARGVPEARFGKPIVDYMRIDDTKPSKLSRNCWRGTILRADRFGNLITNFHLDDFARVTAGPFELRIGSECIRRLALTFSEAAIGELVAVFGSSDYLEIVANQASAAEILGCGARSPVELEIF